MIKKTIINSIIAAGFIIIAIAGAVVLSLVWKDCSDTTSFICATVCATIIICFALTCATVSLAIVVKGYVKYKKDASKDNSDTAKILLEAYEKIIDGKTPDSNNGNPKK